MTQTHEELLNKILRLPAEKLNIAMTFIDFLEQQKDIDIYTETSANNSADAKKPFSEMRGLFKGKIRMFDDFDEPLEEMREYMENPYAEKIRKHGYSITIHYSPEDVDRMTQNAVEKIKSLDMLELDPDEIAALEKYRKANFA